MLRLRSLLILLLISAAHAPLNAQSGVIDFEDLVDSSIITNQHPGLTFSNAIILTAGISLNEFEFPPRSGQNVASDNIGPITITFASPVASFAAYFTYATRLTVTAFDAAGNPVDQTVSLFNKNMTLSGDSGSNSNELLKVSSGTGVAKVRITGDPAGGSFALDDVSTAPLDNSDLLFLYFFYSTHNGQPIQSLWARIDRDSVSLQLGRL